MFPKFKKDYSFKLNNSPMFIHYGNGSSIREHGGMQTVIKEMAVAQAKSGTKSYIVDCITLTKNNKYEVFGSGKIVQVKSIPKNHDGPIIHYFHFCFTMLKILSYNPLRYMNINVLQFHGPWSAESKIQGQGSIKVQLKFFLEKLIFRVPKIIICASESFKSLLENTYNVPAKKVYAVKLGVNFQSFQKARTQKLRRYVQKHFVVGTIRRLEPRMGIDVLLRSMLLETKFNLVIAGAGSQERYLQDLARSIGIQERVKFLGKISETEKLNFYSSLDLFVLPSIALEGFGLVILESMASGVPVIASNLPGILEALGPFATSNSFESNSEEALATSIKNFIDGKIENDSYLYEEWAAICSWKSVINNIQNIVAQ